MPSRVAPHSLEAEKAILGAVLVDSKTWYVVAAVLRASDFYRAAHGLLFDAMARLVARGVGVDLLTVSEELSTKNELDEVGGPAYIGSLTDGVPRSANVAYYAQIVLEKAMLRRLSEAGAWLQASAYDPDGRTASSLADEASGRLLETVGQAPGGLLTAEAAIGGYVDAMSGGSLGEPIRTGYVDFDSLVGGLKPCDLVIVAARPSVGKTSWALGAAENMARRSQAPLFFSLEMSSRGLASRLLSWRSQVQSSLIERGEATEADYQRVIEVAHAEPAGVSILIQETARTLTEISAWARRAMQQGPLACIIVDYMQLIAAEGRYASRQEAMASISIGLKRIAKDLGVMVLALSQLSRASEDRRDKRPQLSDLRESGSLEQDADVVVLLFREEMHKPKPENAGIAEAIVAKNRNGPCGVTRLNFNAPLAQFRNLAT